MAIKIYIINQFTPALWILNFQTQKSKKHESSNQLSTYKQFKTIISSQTEAQEEANPHRANFHEKHFQTDFIDLKILHQSKIQSQNKKKFHEEANSKSQLKM